jgi:NAD/NADP transhydrogenase alpha subunit
MAVSLTVLKEAGGEPRVAATPETVKKMSALGIKVTVADLTTPPIKQPAQP